MIRTNIGRINGHSAAIDRIALTVIQSAVGSARSSLTPAGTILLTLSLAVDC